MATGNIQELEQRIKDGSIDTVIVAFPDHFGQLMGKRMTGEFFLDHREVASCNYLLTTDIEMEPLEGFELGSWSRGFGDFRIAADPGSLKYPGWEPRSALLIGDLLDDKGREVAQSPRAILKGQVEEARNMGFRPMMASELEFYLFNNSFFDVMNRGFDAIVPASSYPIDYHILGTGYSEKILEKIRKLMNRTGIRVESSKGETGRGQFELALEYTDALEMADRHIIYKYGTKALAAEEGQAVTFMAKYTHEEAGSSCHIHCSLADLKSGRNLFRDSSADRESETFRHFLGGLHHLSAELFLFFAPNVNSYKRYTSGSFAPTHIAWDYDNRTTSFRIVGEGQEFRVENRMPGADANPYLAYSAMLAAGLYGIRQKIEPPEKFSGDAYHSEELGKLPSSLEEAAAGLDRSSLARKIFGDAVIDHYVHHALLEARAYKRIVGEWELKRYFERY